MKRGRKPALTVSQAASALSLYNTTTCSIDRVARHYGVSHGVIAKIIDGTYHPREDEPDEAEKEVGT